MTVEASPGLPIGNAEIPATASPGASVVCKFALGDTTSTDLGTRMRAGFSAGGFPNLRVIVSAVLDGNLVDFDISPNAITYEIDTLTTGLGLNTGLNVIGLPLTFTAIAPTTVDVIFENVHSIIR